MYTDQIILYDDLFRRTTLKGVVKTVNKRYIVLSPATIKLCCAYDDRCYYRITKKVEKARISINDLERILGVVENDTDRDR